MPITPLQSGIFVHKSIEGITKILKKRFQNLSAEEIIQLSGDIAMLELELAQKELWYSEVKP